MITNLRARSTRARLVAWNIATLAILLLALGVGVHFMVRSIMLASIDRELDYRTERFAHPPRRFGPDNGPVGPGFGGPDGRSGQPDGRTGAIGQALFGLLRPGPPEGLGEHIGQPSAQAGPNNQAPGVPGQPGGSNGSRGKAGANTGSKGKLPAPTKAPSQQGGQVAPLRQVDGNAGTLPQMPDWMKQRGPRHPQDPYEAKLYTVDGTFIFPGPEQKPLHMASIKQAAKGAIVYVTTSYSGEPIRILSRPQTESGQVTAVVQAGYPLSSVYQALAGLDTALLAIVPLCLILAGAGGFFLTDRVLRPVRYLTQTAEQIGAEDLSLRLEADGHDEFSQLARTLNAMLARLDAAFREQARQIEKQRRFTADASHELRTPLTVIKANTSLCMSGHPTAEDYQQSVEDIDRAANAMSRLVQDLLLLARSDAGQLARDPVPVPIVEILDHAIARTGAAQNGHIRGLNSIPPICVMGSPDELVRVFANLIDNAERHIPDGGSIDLRAEPNDGAVRIAVQDDGSGIAPEHLTHLGERFYRVDEARARADGGTGLGLSICKGIVEAHGGRIEFESEVGKGTTVTVTLPVAEAPTDE